MGKKLVGALVLMLLTVLVLILNAGGKMDVKLPFYLIEGAMRPLVFLFLIVDGVAIGLLLK